MRDTIIPGGGRLDPPSREAKIAGERVMPLREAVFYGRASVSHVPGLLMRTFEEGAWRSFSLPHGRAVYTYPTFQAFIEDWLELTPGELKATCEFAAGIQEKGHRRGNSEDDQKALALLAEITAQNPTALTGVTRSVANSLTGQVPGDSAGDTDYGSAVPAKRGR